MPPARAAAPASSALCTDRPTTAPAPEQRRTAGAAMESPRRCTPCAPAAAATSARSFTSTFVAASFRHSEASADECCERARVEVALADLNQIDACLHSRRREIDQPIDGFGTGRQAPAVGHQANHDCSIVSIVSMRRRASSTAASSLKPISRLTTPRPDTPPRT